MLTLTNQLLYRIVVMLGLVLWCRLAGCSPKCHNEQFLQMS